MPPALKLSVIFRFSYRRTALMYGHIKNYLSLTQKASRKMLPVYRRIISAQQASFGEILSICGAPIKKPAMNGGVSVSPASFP